MFEQEFFVILWKNERTIGDVGCTILTRKLDDHGALEDILQPFGENERHHVPEMHAVATRSATGVKEERLSLLIPIQDIVELSMRS